MDHVKEEDRQKHLEEENKPMSFLMNLFEKKKFDNTKKEETNSEDIYKGTLTPAEYLSISSSEIASKIGKITFL